MADRDRGLRPIGGQAGSPVQELAPSPGLIKIGGGEGKAYRFLVFLALGSRKVLTTISYNGSRRWCSRDDSASRRNPGLFCYFPLTSS